jgi:hypothetical protein
MQQYQKEGGGETFSRQDVKDGSLDYVYFAKSQNGPILPKFVVRQGMNYLTEDRNLDQSRF